MADDDRTVVKTYVPRHQKERWTDHADELDMTQSEFLRTMVQAGRRGFERQNETNGEEPGSPDATPGVDGLETAVLDVLREEGVADWPTLLETLAERTLADELESALADLQSEGEVVHRPRAGGYALQDDV